MHRLASEKLAFVSKKYRNQDENHYGEKGLICCEYFVI
jgi:hypothetical protein